MFKRIGGALITVLKAVFTYDNWKAELEEIQQQEDAERYHKLIDDQTLSWIRLNGEQLTWLIANQEQISYLLQIQTPAALRKMAKLRAADNVLADVDKMIDEAKAND